MRERIKRILRAIDAKHGRRSYEKARLAERIWHDSGFLNAVRRRKDPFLTRMKHAFRPNGKRPLRLHLGCGSRHFEGYVNVDLRKTSATDLVCSITNLPFPDNSAELIETYHVVEHLSRHDLPKALRAWHRVLMPGGKLIIECPDFDGAVKEYLAGDERRLDSIFGLQRFAGDTHRFGYNRKRLQNLLEEAGFRDIEERRPQDYHSREEPCLRMECVKGTRP